MLTSQEDDGHWVNSNAGYATAFRVFNGACRVIAESSDKADSANAVHLQSSDYLANLLGHARDVVREVSEPAVIMWEAQLSNTHVLTE